MLEIDGLSLIITDKCNACCRHCGFSAGPDKKNVMTMKTARECIKELALLGSAKLVSYTGGEPFLFFDYLKEIVSFSDSLGFYGEVVTNSFWAENMTLAREKLISLKKLGVINFVTSLDDYHIEFIKPEYIKNAVLTACDLGYHVTVKTIETPDSYFTYTTVKSFLETDKNKIKIISQSPVTAGRAKGQPSTLNSAHPEQSGGNCRTVIRFPAVDPKGNVFPCCGFGDKRIILGNINQTPLSIILHEMRHNLFLNLLACAGPKALLNSAQQYFSQTPRNHFPNTCEACNYIVQNADAALAVKRFLEQLL